MTEQPKAHDVLQEAINKLNLSRRFLLTTPDDVTPYDFGRRRMLADKLDEAVKLANDIQRDMAVSDY